MTNLILAPDIAIVLETTSLELFCEEVPKHPGINHWKGMHDNYCDKPVHERDECFKGIVQYVHQRMGKDLKESERVLGNLLRYEDKERLLDYLAMELAAS